MRRLNFDPKECPEHDNEPIGTCHKCAAEASSKPDNFRELIERSRKQHQQEEQ